MTYLFTTPEQLPAEVQQILQQYSKSDFTYTECNELLSLLQPHGYSFEYGLDAIPYNLTKSVLKAN